MQYMRMKACRSHRITSHKSREAIHIERFLSPNTCHDQNTQYSSSKFAWEIKIIKVIEQIKKNIVTRIILTLCVVISFVTNGDRRLVNFDWRTTVV